MGISGLLPLLEKSTRPCHVSEFRGRTVAIDSYCWLHKGATSCAEQLARGQQTNMYVLYCLKYVKLLLSYDIKPIMVFDGKNLPAKLDTELKRRQNRSNAKQRAAELLCLGKTVEARTYLKQCIDITPQMANNLMRECRKLNVDCIVAPYESDAQLAFFNIKGVADFIISEDSDLILFGCKKVLYKMDLAGSGQLVESDKLYLSLNMRPDQFTFDKFRYMCILSGCDYAESLPGIGLKKSLKFINLTAETNPHLFLDKVPRYLNMRHLVITPEYKEKFLVAEATFRHQIVFDPFKRKLVPLADPKDSDTKPEYCKNAGEIYDNEEALQIALGNIHPNTKEKIDDWQPDIDQSLNLYNLTNSIWSSEFKKKAPTQLKPERRQEIKVIAQNKQVLIGSVAEDDEKSEVEYDMKLKKELLIYSEDKKEIQETKVKNEVIDTTVTVMQKQTSPVLKKNPFLVKKLSKFQNTEINSKTVVRSRFFSSNVEDISAAETKATVSVEDNSSEEITAEPSSSQKENRCSENSTESSEKIEKCEIVNSRKRLFEDTEDSNEEECIIDEQEPPGESSGVSSPQTMLQHSRQRDIVQRVREFTSVKKKRLGACRTLGLTKSKSQPTLLHLFSQMNKKQ